MKCTYILFRSQLNPLYSRLKKEVDWSWLITIKICLIQIPNDPLFLLPSSMKPNTPHRCQQPEKMAGSCLNNHLNISGQAKACIEKLWEEANHEILVTCSFTFQLSGGFNVLFCMCQHLSFFFPLWGFYWWYLAIGCCRPGQPLAFATLLFSRAGKRGTGTTVVCNMFLNMKLLIFYTIIFISIFLILN